jgi:hypothetical protein
LPIELPRRPRSDASGGRRESSPLREAEERAAQTAERRRQRWEGEYQDAVANSYTRQLLDAQQLCDELEAEINKPSQTPKQTPANKAGLPSPRALLVLFAKTMRARAI